MLSKLPEDPLKPRTHLYTLMQQCPIPHGHSCFHNLDPNPNLEQYTLRYLCKVAAAITFNPTKKVICAGATMSKYT